MENLNDKNGSFDLKRLFYPNDLRSDRASLTFVDDSGNCYIIPNANCPHDISVSKELISNGLSVGNIVTISQKSLLTNQILNLPQEVVSYSSDKELIPVGQLLNSELKSPGGENRILEAFSAISDLFKKIELKLGAVPESPNDDFIDMIAIDKATGKAELIPPYFISNDRISGLQAFEKFRNNILMRTNNTEDIKLLNEKLNHTIAVWES